ncbi:MAG: hypothetical protein IRZ07_08285 [Microbispora sp.]|nr:hypothetical protein [Microbispora sp.]
MDPNAHTLLAPVNPHQIGELVHEKQAASEGRMAGRRHPPGRRTECPRAAVTSAYGGDGQV